MNRRQFGVPLLMSILGLLAVHPPLTAQEIGMMTGTANGPHIQFGNRIAEMAQRANLAFLVKESANSLDTIRHMTSKDNAGMGMVQSDVLGFLSRSADHAARRLASQLRLVVPLYDEAVHLLAHRRIQHLTDLAHKRVVVGIPGSNNWLTAHNLLRLADVQPVAYLKLAPLEAISAVLTGKADAMFYVASKPATLFTHLKTLRNQPRYAELVKQVHFVPLGDDDLLRDYVPATISQQDYKWMGKPIDTVAVKTILIAFDFSRRETAYSRQCCDQLARFGQVLREDFAMRQQAGQAKWQEAALDGSVNSWQRDTCSTPVAISATSQRDDTAAIVRLLKGSSVMDDS